jgi:hypothetical protein
MKRYRLFAALALVALIAASCAKKAEQAAQSTGTEPAATASTPRPEARLLRQWMIGLTNRRPGLDAVRMNHLGNDALGVNVTGEASSWFEMVDIDSNGTKEKVGFMWDATNKVMYAYTQDPITLNDGSMAGQGFMVTQFGENNTRGRATGSGWWAYALQRDTTAAGKVQGTLYGCTFDKLGNELECGTGTFSREGNEFSISVKPQ